MNVWTITKGHSHVSLRGLLRPTLQLLDWAALIRKVTLTPIWAVIFSSLASVRRRPPWPYLFPLVSQTPPSLPQLPTTTPTTPPVCLAVTQSAMCVPKTLHNALLSLHSGSKRTIQHRKKKIAPCWFSSLPPSHCFIRLSVPRDYTVDYVIICFSIPLHVGKLTEQMGNDQRFTEEDLRLQAQTIQHLTFFFWCAALIHLLVSLHVNPVREKYQAGGEFPPSKATEIFNSLQVWHFIFEGPASLKWGKKTVAKKKNQLMQSSWNLFLWRGFRSNTLLNFPPTCAQAE